MAVLLFSSVKDGIISYLALFVYAKNRPKPGLNRDWVAENGKGNSLASDAEGLYYFDCILNFEREKMHRRMEGNAKKGQ